MIADVVVVGGGVVGSSVAFHLAAAGTPGVVVCEQGPPPGQGATARSAGLLRVHHTARCDVRLAAESLPVFQQWADVVGGECGYRRAGFVMLVDRVHEDSLAKNVAEVASHGVESRVLSADELALLYPALDPGAAVAAHEPDGGWADPVMAAGGLLAAATARGVRSLSGAEATAVVVRGDRVVAVETNVGRIATGVVVVAAGAWSPAISATTGVEVPVTPRRIGLAAARAGAIAAGVPATIDDGLGAYFRGGSGVVEFGVTARPEADVERHPVPLRREEIEAAAALVATRLPVLRDAPLVGSRVGVDGYTPDRRPVIGPAGPAGLYLCTGFSGGGFKTAPAVGRLVAAEVSGAAQDEALGDYRPGRFAAGRPIEGEHPYGRM